MLKVFAGKLIGCLMSGLLAEFQKRKTRLGSQCCGRRYRQEGLRRRLVYGGCSWSQALCEGLPELFVGSRLPATVAFRRPLNERYPILNEVQHLNRTRTYSSLSLRILPVRALWGPPFVPSMQGD